MDIITLATAAWTIVSPFVNKTGEGVARRVGEDLWQLIKKPFTSEDDQKLIENLETPEAQSAFQSTFLKKLQDDPQFLKEVASLTEDAKRKLASYQQQNIHNNAPIEKQVNISNNSGNLNF